MERLDLRVFEADYEEEGRPAYHPAMMVGVWLYAYELGITSSRRLEQRVREDLGFRYLAGGAQPDYWTLNEFRRRHPKGLNDLFTQVVELAREAGLGRLGHVAIDSTRVKANASANPTDSGEKLRAERLRVRRQIRRWQQACEAEDPNETPGLELGGEERRRRRRLRCRARNPVHRQMRRKLRGRAGRAIYGRRKALIEPVFGVLKEQRGLRQFRRRGLEKVAVEVAMAATAYNLTRLWSARSGV